MKDGLVVSYRNSTSNHNADIFKDCDGKLYLIEILHQTTTTPIISITPALLYLIEILHQTTTQPLLRLEHSLLYLIEILHQTTTE